ncbi:MAG TPA: outer membrane protein assembly factor BamD [Chthoniobacterales bacterium]|jgi:outer membrane protein assembly factor BamD (BamD/ComL family)
MKITAASLLLLTSMVYAAEPTLFQQAQTAIQEGIPQVGIQKLQLCLAQPLSTEETRNVRLELAKAYLALKDSESARQQLANLSPDGDVRFLLIQSYLTDRNWRLVEQLTTSLPPPESPFYCRFVFARAEARRGLGRDAEADQDYKLIENDAKLGNAARLRRADLALQSATPPPLILPKSDDPAVARAATLLQAQSSLLSKNYPEAERSFRLLFADPAQLTSSDYAAVCLGLARALGEQSRLDEAGDLLESFIDQRPRHEKLSDIFAELNSVYQREKNPSQNQLRRWSRDAKHPERQALAIYYQSQFDLRDKGSDAALATLSAWLDKFPSHSLRSSVLLRYGEQLVAEKKVAEGIRRLTEGLSLSASKETTGELHVALAKAFYATNKFARAAEHFKQASQFLTRSTEHLLYNVALCWLRGSEFQKFLTVYQEFSQLFPESDLRRDLLIEEGFLQARSEQLKEARDTLRLFVRDFPEHPRRADAHIALAEISMAASGSETAEQLALAAQAKPAPEVLERAAYLNFFQKNSQEKTDHQKRIAEAEAFLKEYPSSTFEAEVRFKLGEAYFAEKDYTSAGAQFELISDKFPDSALVEQARFLAGQSAVRTMSPKAIDGAIPLFQKVVQMKGTLKDYALYELATIKKNAAAYGDAIILYNDLLGQNPPADLLASTLASKAETHYLQGDVDPKNLDEAIATFDRLINLPDVSRYWKNLALYKKGKALQWQGKKAEMLAAYYDALALPSEQNETPEYFWFYRAGFDAAETLETDQQWTAAIAIYRKLADAKGPRSAEAEERIKRLRLEHFIWEKE